MVTAAAVAEQRQDATSSFIKSRRLFANSQNTNNPGSLPKSLLIHLVFILDSHLSA
jgi:hypothetical protein